MCSARVAQPFVVVIGVDDVCCGTGDGAGDGERQEEDEDNLTQTPAR